MKLARRSSLFIAVFFAFVAGALLSGVAAAADATISGPVTTLGARPNAFHATVDDLKSHGYIEQEFLMDGTAKGRARPDEAVSAAPYRTRMLVRRPVDPKKFNGTVVVEWSNVTLGYDLEVGWPILSDLMMREGYAWVGITNQPVGIRFLQQWDPQRYEGLKHPAIPAVMPKPASPSGFVVITGESYSDAIYTQLGVSLRHPGAVDPLGGLKPQRLLSWGLSQSAGRLTTYINNLPKKDRTYDGYFLFVGPGKLRDDLDVPVFGVNSENEMMRYFPNRRPDSAVYRYWEVPGSGHVPRLSDDTLQAQNRRDGATWPRTCDFGPAVVSIEYASRAALHHLNEWVKTGKEPPHAPFATIEAEKPSTMHGEPGPVAIVRDKSQNALGGIRLPHMEAPTGRHVGSGTPQPMCTLTPGFAPFDAAKLTTLYPTHDAYVSKVQTAAANAVKAGFLLPIDAKAIIAEAAASDVGRNGAKTTSSK